MTAEELARLLDGATDGDLSGDEQQRLADELKDMLQHQQRLADELKDTREELAELRIRAYNAETEMFHLAVKDRDEAREAAYRLMSRFAPRYEIDTWRKLYPWLRQENRS